METPPFKTHDFVFSFKRKGVESISVIEVPIPLNTNVQEYGYRMMTQHGIPCYTEDAFFAQLETFVTKCTDNFYDDLALEAINKVKNGEVDKNQIAEKWGQAFKKEHAAFLDEALPVDEMSKFATMYHTLIHSPALETMLNLEHSYALSVGTLVIQKDVALEELHRRHTHSIEEAINKLGTEFTDQDINRLYSKNFAEQEEQSIEWDNKIEQLMDTQRNEFREWVSKVHEDYKSGCGSPGYIEKIRSLSESIMTEPTSDWTPQPIRLEESFTIHLGSQLKSMNNLRVLAADIMDFCKYKVNNVSGMMVPSPQRLQTAMSLYSNNLCSLVLLVDNRVNSYSGLKHEFARVCRMSTEFHFPDHEQQLEKIRLLLKENKTGDEVYSPKHSDSKTQHLSPGDFYITKHSNLSEIHAAFHLVSDDLGNVTSRHPVLLGLRNILRVAHERDITTLTIPLLLVHEMTEEMTIPWCMKRAELVFKCVKGFMIEMASMLGNITKTVQFLVPKEISEDLFSSLCTLLPNIFRLSNTVVLTSPT